MALSLATAVTYRPALSLVSSQTAHRRWPWTWMLDALTFKSMHTWVPWLAIGVFATLVVLATHTSGFRHANQLDLAGLAGAGPVAALVAMPLLIALAIGILTLVVIAVATIAVVIGVLFTLGAILSDL